MDQILTTLSIAFSLFILMDPMGNVPIFISLLKNISSKRQRIIIIRELIVALGVIILFNYIGGPLLGFLGVQSHTIMIAGGLILFLIALKMIFPPQKADENDLPQQREPFIVPLAIPLIAGPAVLASVMIYSEHVENNWIMIFAIVLSWAATTVILLFSSFLKSILGWRGLIACERLMGLLLTLISVQMFLEGLQSYFRFSAT